ncbi:MAG: substrate-binding domain-containing protein [Candidatus Omnitrophica bacterium]|nr:substrate-binding domain-containing protein [Candidatus Omnitrophota bacterium]MDD5237177.1 substrate-binding domain-containing protein [Candidatus Omnitrophota bacterium]MDD5609917.1 substrate-binding domain-containing protein [Candidatus Omnitrophota bacterium]
MRKITIYSVFVLIICGLFCNPVFAAGEDLSGTITISGAWAIYPTVVAWADSFKKMHTKVKIDVSAGGAGKGAADAIAGLVDIGMVSREPDPAEMAKGVTAVYILHDAVYPIISENNFVKDAILKQGLKKDVLIGIYIKETIKLWDDAVIGKSGRSLHVYTRSDSCGAAAAWAGYLGKKQEDLKGIGIYADPGIIETVKKDPLGIGYSNFSYVFTREGKVLDGIKLVPIDANENGVADREEIYNDRQSAIKAIEAGKYPVTRKNYLFVKGKPQGLVLEFIKFVLSDEGTKVVEEVGTSLALPKQEREKVLSQFSAR